MKRITKIWKVGIALALGLGAFWILNTQTPIFGYQRTVTDPVSGSTLSSAVVRAAFQTLEDEITSIFTFTTQYNVSVAGTSSIPWFQSGLFASSTSHFASFDSVTSTTTSATTTSFASTTICLTGDICRTTWPTSSVTFSFPFTTLGTGQQATSTTMEFLNGLISTASSTFSGAVLHLASTTLQNFTGQNATTSQATTTSLNISGNALSFTSSPIYVNGTTTAAFNLGTTTLDATYRNYGSGSTTLLLANYPEPRKLIGYYCVASSTTAVQFPAIVRFHHDKSGNNTESNWCTTGGYTPVSTNASWTAFEGVDIEASSSANMIGRITITAVWQKLSP